jgi:hypothetical protein
MIKDIKEVLHLYIGQWCVADGNRFQLNGVYTSEKGTLAFNGETDPKTHSPIGWWVENCDFKIELRKLSSMTEEEHEAYEIHYMGLDRQREEDHHSICPAEIEAELTRYLLSRGFDLFGLIEEGLAIEKK